MSVEIWKDIKGYEGSYQVGNKGRIKSLWFINGTSKTRRDLIMTPTDNGNGYLIVFLNGKGSRKREYVHRLVADAFCEKRDGCEYVNHLDYDKRNNDAANLEWCTQGENVRYSADRMRKRRSVTHAKTGEKGIYMRGDKYRIVIDGKEYPSRATLAEAIAYRNEIMERG